MLDLLTASPSVGSLRLDPMTTAEIDAHPDCDRIWATIAAMRDATGQQEEEAEEDRREIRAQAEEEQRSEDIAAITVWAAQVKREFEAAHPDQGEVPAVAWLSERISKVGLAL